jgi:periplasmic protein CpxP/Spy
MTGGIIGGTMSAGGMTGRTITVITIADATASGSLAIRIQAPTRRSVRSKHMSVRRIFGGSREVAAGAAVWLALSAGPAVVASAGLNTARAQAQTSTGAAAAGTQSSVARHDKERAGIDALIDQLHGSLKITSEQEPLWRGVTKVMRENAETMSRLAQERAEHAPTATALDNLKSSAEISEAHVAGTKRMIPVFQALYDSMSSEQKKATDAEFRGHLQEHAQ